MKDVIWKTNNFRIICIRKTTDKLNGNGISKFIIQKKISILGINIYINIAKFNTDKEKYEIPYCFEMYCGDIPIFNIIEILDNWYPIKYI